MSEVVGSYVILVIIKYVFSGLMPLRDSYKLFSSGQILLH